MPLVTAKRSLVEASSAIFVQQQSRQDLLLWYVLCRSKPRDFACSNQQPLRLQYPAHAELFQIPGFGRKSLFASKILCVVRMLGDRHLKPEGIARNFRVNLFVFLSGEASREARKLLDWSNAVSINELKRFTGLLVYSKFSFVVARRHLVATVTSVSVSHALIKAHKNSPPRGDFTFKKPSLHGDFFKQEYS